MGMMNNEPRMNAPDSSANKPARIAGYYTRAAAVSSNKRELGVEKNRIAPGRKHVFRFPDTTQIAPRFVTVFVTGAIRNKNRLAARNAAKRLIEIAERTSGRVTQQPLPALRAAR